MYKDFDKWNEIKKMVDIRAEKFYFHEGEIWCCSIGLNIADESCGKGVTFRRPVLILKKLSKTTFIGIPLSTKSKFGTWFTAVKVNNTLQCFLLYQIRMFSINRFQRRLAALNPNELIYIKTKLRNLLSL